jgi:hypothetical protein
MYMFCSPYQTMDADCGGGGFLDLTGTINGLAGELTIDCDYSGGKCSFQQSVLTSLFGSQGLGLSGCQMGECVRQGTIDSVVAENAAGNGGLSGGVIAGLAVLGAIVALLALLLVVGWRRQRKAAKDAGKDEAAAKEAKLSWRHVGYSLPSTSGPMSFFRPLGLGGATRRVPIGRAPDDGKVLIDSINGSVTPGSLLAILGPSGAGKSTLVDILAGKRKIGRRSGVVELIPTTPEVEGDVTVGYVDQNDVLPPTASKLIQLVIWLTGVGTEWKCFFFYLPAVRESLLFAANLKLPESVSRETKEYARGSNLSNFRHSF